MKRFSKEKDDVEFALNAIASAYSIVRYHPNSDALWVGDTHEEKHESLRKYIEKFWNDITEEQVLEYLRDRHYVNDKVGGAVVGKQQAKLYMKALVHFDLMSIPREIRKNVNR